MNMFGTTSALSDLLHTSSLTLVPLLNSPSHHSGDNH